MRDPELRHSPFAPLLNAAYRVRRLRPFVLGLTRLLEGGEFYSDTLRRILDRYHGVRLGAYSYGTGAVPGAFPAGVTIGRYVSIADGVRVLLRNHPLDTISTHPFFFNTVLGWVPRDTVEFSTLDVGHDAWIGAGAIITSKCRRIGIGAVVGAGAVVTRDVPDFAIVVGNPARVIKFRFPEETREIIKASRWWDHTPTECVRHMPAMIEPIGSDPSGHPLLRDAARRAAQTEAALR
jgi:virginiamycin A acetyltransferase